LPKKLLLLQGKHEAAANALYKFSEEKEDLYIIFSFFGALSIIGKVRSSCNCPPPVTKREEILVCIIVAIRCSFHC
jgi:hypothetical protein